MFNRPDKNVNKSTRDQAERIYWVTCTIDALGVAMTEHSEYLPYNAEDYGKMLRMLTDEIKTESLDLIEFN